MRRSSTYFEELHNFRDPITQRYTPFSYFASFFGGALFHFSLTMDYYEITRADLCLA